MRKNGCLTLILLLALPGALHSQSARPNVLLVLSDDHSAAHVGAYGNPDLARSPEDGQNRVRDQRRSQSPLGPCRLTRTRARIPECPWR
jgi:hypothetical protein